MVAEMWQSSNKDGDRFGQVCLSLNHPKSLLDVSRLALPFGAVGIRGGQYLYFLIYVDINIH